MVHGQVVVLVMIKNTKDLSQIQMVMVVVLVMIKYTKDLSQQLHGHGSGADYDKIH